MSPPSPALAQFLDRGGWSSATVFAGRPFHFHYEAMGLKLLLMFDLPAIIATIPASLLLGPVSKPFGFYAESYVSAALMFLGATCQWLLVGRKCEQWVGRKLPAVQRRL